MSKVFSRGVIVMRDLFVQFRSGERTVTGTSMTSMTQTGLAATDTITCCTMTGGTPEIIT